MLAIRLHDGRTLRVEAGRCVFDGLDDVEFVVHNAYDPFSGDVAERQFSVTELRTGAALVKEVYGDADDAINVAKARIAHVGPTRLRELLSNLPTVNRDDDSA